MGAWAGFQRRDLIDRVGSERAAHIINNPSKGREGDRPNTQGPWQHTMAQAHLVGQRSAARRSRHFRKFALLQNV